MPILRHDDVALAYERTGSGRPVILIHGWCCDRSFMAPQAEHLARRGFDVVALDLRAHGQSDKPEQPYPIGAFGGDIAFVCAALGLVRPVLIGHSMGGIIAYDVARLHPELPAAIVMLDSSVVPPDQVRATMWQTVERLEGPDHAQALRDLVGNVLFIPTDDPERRRRILDFMAAAPQHLMVGGYAGLAGYDPGPDGAVTVPSLYIAADEPTARADMVKVRALLPQLQYGQTVGSGHFCQLEVPDQVNAMIDRFLALAALIDPIPA